MPSLFDRQTRSIVGKTIDLVKSEGVLSRCPITRHIKGRELTGEMPHLFGFLRDRKTAQITNLSLQLLKRFNNVISMDWV